MGKARFPGFLGSEADGNGSWWASRNGEPRYLVEDSGACRYCTLEIVSWWDSMLKTVSRDSMLVRLNAGAVVSGLLCYRNVVHADELLRE